MEYAGNLMHNSGHFNYALEAYDYSNGRLGNSVYDESRRWLGRLGVLENLKSEY